MTASIQIQSSSKRALTLRQTATNLLRTGTAPPTGTFISNEVLNLLHNLVITPDSSDHAMALLHELQVYQVELDLQQDQLVANALEFTEDQRRYSELYRLAPFGYFVISRSGEILEANTAGAKLFGEPDSFAMHDCKIDRYLSHKSRQIMAALLERLNSGSIREHCEVHPNVGDLARPLQVIATPSSDKEIFLMTIFDKDEF